MQLSSSNHNSVTFPLARNASARDLGTRPSIAELVALQAVGWPFTALTLTALLFMAGIPIGPYHLWAALVLFLVVGARLSGDWREWLTAALWLALCAVAGGASLGWLYDFSGDGQWYHLPGILALAQGWNPFHVPRLADWNPAFAQAIASPDINYPGFVYVQHYAKGAWIVAAVAYRGTGLLEATKVFNLLYVLAVYLTAVALLSRLGLSRLWSRAIAVAAAANPVSLYQLASFFVDGQLASLCTLVLLSSLDYFFERKMRALFLVGGAVVLLSNVKFTGVAFAAGLVGGMGVLGWLRGRKDEVKRYAMVGGASLLVAILVAGYQPYVTNARDYGHPFYPALGREDARNVQWHSAPAPFMAMNPVEKLVRSLFARPAGADEMPEWKIPLAVSKQELYIFFNAEPRYGGFGPLFGAALLLAIAAFPLAIRAMPRNVWTAGASLAILVAASALVNPEAWWARLSPQFWLVPLVLATSMALGAAGWPRRTAMIVVLFLLANSLLVGALNLGRATEKNLVFREQLADLRAMAATGPVQLTVHRSFQMVTELRMREHAVRYQTVSNAPCAMPLRFSFPASAQATACPSP